MESELLFGLTNRSITKQELLQKVRRDFSLLPEVLNGTCSTKAAIRYGCSKVLMDLSEEQPERLYPYMNRFADLLNSQYRILKWNAMTIIANLAKIDKDGKFDSMFDKYYSFLNDEYMVTVANVVGNSGKIALAKPYLIDKIATKLLEVDDISLTPHMTEECKRVIAEKAIETFDLLFDKITRKKRLISFVEKHTSSSRRTLRATARNFLKKWAR